MLVVGHPRWQSSCWVRYVILPVDFPPRAILHLTDSLQWCLLGCMMPLASFDTNWHHKGYFKPPIKLSMQPKEVPSLMNPPDLKLRPFQNGTKQVILWGGPIPWFVQPGGWPAGHKKYRLCCIMLQSGITAKSRFKYSPGMFCRDATR